MITIREIEYKGKTIIVEADETGMLYVNGRTASRPVSANGLTFVWGGEHDGLPKHTKISLDSAALQKIDQHSSEFRASQASLARKAKEYNDLHNEGGEGFNPYA